ncbi:MAG: cyanophycin synthetase, partial [candidate division Zixibacteria bacterium]
YRAQGYKTGLFTSPHLVSLRERVRVNGRMIPKRSVAAFMDRHRKKLLERKLSFFEVVTAMALEFFSRAEVEIAIIETGLGGRLDATNVLTPKLTITTDISRDHLEILGTTIRKIAREKAGILKKSVPHLVGLLPETAERVMREHCRRMGSRLFKLNPQDFAFNPEKLSLDFKYNGMALSGVRPSLIGPQQLKNTALVLKAVSILNERGLRVSKRAILHGISHTDWPGRFQIVEYRDKPVHIFDVCHNAAGVEAFAQTFRIRFPGKRARIIMGFVKRKEHQKMFNSLSKVADSYALVPLRTGRSINLSELIRNIDWKDVPFKKYGTLKTAYKKTLRNSERGDIVAVIGSHYLVGEFFDKIGV